MKKFAACALLGNAFLVANPSGGTFLEGGGSITGTTSLNVTLIADINVINWDSFSIGSTELVTFTRAGTSSGYYVLNNVPSGPTSTIAGSLMTTETYGNIYLVNPAGVVVSSSGVVVTGGFLASTLPLITPFSPGSAMTFAGLSNTTLSNAGNITTLTGDLTLLGYQIVNNGTISGCGSVALGAGINILVQPTSNQRIFILASGTTSAATGILGGGSISGESIILNADGNPYSLAINLTGTITVNSCDSASGNVLILASTIDTCVGAVQITGNINRASATGTGPGVTINGTTINIAASTNINVSGSTGGGAVTIGSLGGTCPTTSIYTALGALITSNATTSGTGGTITLAATTSNLFLGSISAQGVTSGGNVFITSSTGYLGMDVSATNAINLSSTSGTFGTLTLTNSDINLGGSGNYSTYFAPPNYTIAALPSTVTTTGVQNALANSSVTLVANNGSFGSSIDVIDNITWASGTQLGLTATDELNVTKLVTMTGTTAGTKTVLALNAGQIVIGVSGNTSTIPTGFIMTTGSINANATDSIYLYGGAAANSIASLSTLSGNQGITFANNFDLLAGDANVANAEVRGTSVTVNGLSGGSGNIVITANDCSKALIDAQVVNIGTTTAVNNMTLTAGCCSNSNEAYIGSLTLGSTITIDMNGILTMTGGTNGSTNRASIISSGGTSQAITISASEINLTGGAGGTSNSARIASTGTGGTVSLTTINDLNLTGGMGIVNTAFVSGTTTTFSIGGDLLLAGGTGTLSGAYIEGTGGVTGGVTRYFIATGGSGSLANGEIRATNGNITLTSLGSSTSYDFRGGSGAVARVYVSGSGNISINSVTDIIYSGSGYGAYAAVGGAGTITQIASRDISLTTGTTTNANVYLQTTNGTITATSGRDTILIGDCNIPNQAYINAGGAAAVVGAGRDIIQIGNTYIQGALGSSLTYSRNHTVIGCSEPESVEAFVLPWPSYIFYYELFYRLRFFNLYDWHVFHHPTFWDTTDYTDP